MKEEKPKDDDAAACPSASSFSLPPSSLFSFFPAIPPRLPVQLTEVPEHACSYLEGRPAQMRAFMVRQLPGEMYHDLMDAGFRRSGKLIYQPICRACRKCVPLRVPVEAFQPGKSQRRCVRRNADVTITMGEPNLTDEKFQMYLRYMRDWHGAEEPQDRESFQGFLYDSPVRSIEMEYRDANSRLIGVGISDICVRSLSSVYFYFDPDERSRGLGTFSVMKEIELAVAHRIPYLYLGYWISGCRKMEYKSDFRPCEVLHGDGRWRPVDLDGLELEE